MIRVRLPGHVGGVSEVRVGGDDALSGLGLGACDEVSAIELEGMR